MDTSRIVRLTRRIALLAALVAGPAAHAALAPPTAVAAGSSATAAAAPSPAGAREGTGRERLKSRHAELRGALERNAFGRPVHLASREGPQVLNGDIHAEVAHAFTQVSESLHRATDWCDILILPFNTKLCTASPAGNALSVYVGRKNNVEPKDAHRLDFAYRVVERTDDYLRLELKAAQGPLGTRDYVIVLEAAAIAPGRTFLHLSYSYAYGTISSLAMKAYLATVGASKVGFSESGRASDGTPELVRGMRGIMERNTMRYYLAIEAYLNNVSTPPEQRVDKRLSDWYAASARYPRQLHEMDRGEYISMKQREVVRMRTAG